MNNFGKRFPALLCFLLLFGGAIVNGQEKPPVITAKHDESKKSVRVEFDGKLFTEYVYNQHAKPILYPIMGPHQTPMTRNFPMKKGVADEADDHPHHKSLSFTHGIVNEDNFWHEGAKESGKIVLKEMIKVEATQREAHIEAKSDWIGHAGNLVCKDTTKLRLGYMGEKYQHKFIEYIVTIEATEGDVTFGDTKEGSMAIRTHPALRLKGPAAKGSAVNSEGVTGKDLWGKKAKWVDYHGPINGKTVGIAIFDHRENLRHPTTWHARDYGLICANPFGLSHFQKKEKGAGNFTIKKGESQTFRYLFLFHEGTTKEAEIENLYDEWIDR